MKVLPLIICSNRESGSAPHLGKKKNRADLGGVSASEVALNLCIQNWPHSFLSATLSELCWAVLESSRVNYEGKLVG